MGRVKSQFVLKQNIRTLLRARGLNQSSLAFFCRKTESWISQILTKPNRGFRMGELDCIADFFGLEVYQLFQPGISPLTERRSGRDRRSGVERRVSHAGAILEHSPSLVELEKLLRGATGLSAEQYRRFSRHVKAALTLEEQGLGAAGQPDSRETGEPGQDEKPSGKQKRRRRES
jgi:hypothetical protein